MHQSDAIKKLKSSGVYDGNINGAVENGICATFVVYWLHEMLKGDRSKSHFLPPNYSFPGLTEQQQAQLAKAAKEEVRDLHGLMATYLAPKHAEYVKIRDSGDKRPGLLVLAPGVPGGMDAKIKLDQARFEDLEAFKFKAGRGYYITLICDNARHAIGMVGHAGEDMTFFDPNAGEYVVSGALWGRFIEEYKHIIEEETTWGKIKSIRICSARLG